MTLQFQHLDDRIPSGFRVEVWMAGDEPDRRFTAETGTWADAIRCYRVHSGRTFGPSDWIGPGSTMERLVCPGGVLAVDLSVSPQDPTLILMQLSS